MIQFIDNEWNNCLDAFDTSNDAIMPWTVIEKPPYDHETVNSPSHRAIARLITIR
jgi:hypothetical protein